MILQKEIRMAESLPVLNLKISPTIGNVLSAGQAKMTLNLKIRLKASMHYPALPEI
jgi:hypothetical protein